MTAKARIAGLFWHPMEYKPLTLKQIAKSIHERAKEGPVLRLSDDEIVQLGQALEREDEGSFNDLRRANKLFVRILHCFRDGLVREDIPAIEPLVARWLNQQGIDHGQRGPEASN